jgi:hypothetical protein
MRSHLSLSHNRALGGVPKLYRVLNRYDVPRLILVDTVD